MAPNNPRNNELRKAVLIPLWICQFVPLISFSVMTSIGLTYAISGLVLLFLSILTLSIICNVTEILLFATQKLRPVAYLILQVIKTKIFLILCLTSFFNIFDLLGEIANIVLFAVFLASMIYASVIVHRQRRLKHSPFTFRNVYERRASKDSVFGDQVELVGRKGVERPASVATSGGVYPLRLDHRF